MVRKVSNCPPGKEFVFKLPNGTVVGQAKNMAEFTEIIKILPLPSLLFHATGGHFSPWLELIGEHAAASSLARLSIRNATARVSILRALR